MCQSADMPASVVPDLRLCVGAADHDRNRQLVQLPLHLEGFKRIIANLHLEAYVSVRDLGIYVTMLGTDFCGFPQMPSARAC